MNRNIRLGVYGLLIFLLCAALAACLSDQREMTGTAARAVSTLDDHDTNYCTMDEDGRWDCGDGGGGGGGGGGPFGTCPGGRQPSCVQCAPGTLQCVYACKGDYSCSGDQVTSCGWQQKCES